MKTFGATLRQLRESKGLLLRHVAAELDIDTALLSKIERGDRSLKREQVIKIAKIVGMSDKKLLILWLSGKLTDLVKNEDYAEEALSMSLNRVKKEK